ncbi:MAG: class I SAM-dependent methyltransferase [Acidimicrobiales bacterium]
MKYDTEINPAEANTSHALMLELVGNDKRVLDVGCATGYLARALIAQGCTVSGVEVDPAAAEEARPVLKELVVGDLETLELGQAFDPGAFDVVVFGDVLEHLSDPLSVLRSSLALLVDDGFVVVSIPNVAHGAVRLSLLNGKFDYSDRGLLDSTHVRFFTRTTVEALFSDAGLVPVDFRRTTADFFDTEIPVARDEVPPGVLARLNHDPEGRTYQFVVKAIPVDSSPGLRRMYEENAAQKAVIARLRRTVNALSGQAAAPAAQVGVWGHFGLEDIRSALLPRILRTELGRRLPGSTIRCFAPVTAQLRVDSGQVVEPLGPWDEARSAQLAAELDAVVVTGCLGVPPSAYPWDEQPERLVRLDTALAQGLGPDAETSCPVLYLGVDTVAHSQPDIAAIRRSVLQHRYVAASDPHLIGDDSDPGPDGGALIPDLLFLVGRLFSPDLLRHRGTYLRLMKWFPPFGRVIVVQGDRRIGDSIPAVAQALNALSAELDARCAVVESKLVDDDASFANDLVGLLQPPATPIPIDAGVVDMIAAVACADAVVTSSPSLMTLALAFGRPCAGLDLADDHRFDAVVRAAGVRDAVVRAPGDIAATLAQAPSAAVAAAAQQRIEAELDRRIDEVAALVEEAAAERRRAEEPPIATASLPGRLAALEGAYAGLQERMAAERLAFADHAEAFRRQAEENLERAKAAQAEAEARLTALMATRTMKVIGPARDFYGRVRARSQ